MSDSPGPEYSQGMLDELQGQRNHAFTRCTYLAGEVAQLKAQLKSLQDSLQELNQVKADLAALKAAASPVEEKPQEKKAAPRAH